MKLGLNKNEDLLLDLLLEIPPNFVDAEQLIREVNMTSECITKVAIRYAEECDGDVGDYLFEHMEPPVDISKAVLPHGIFPGLHSTHLYDVIKFLLDFGLNPNAVYTEESFPHNIMNID